MSFTQFLVHGPIAIPAECKYRYYGYWRIREGASQFWKLEDAAKLRDRKGCYVFGVRAGRGIRITYVGLTIKQTFGTECFTRHKVKNHYNVGLRKRKNGTAVMFFVVAPKGKTPSLRIPQVETFLIQSCVANGVSVTNERKRGYFAWGITGISPKARGRPQESAALLRKSMKMRH
jgi:hypothetical protein